MSVIITRTFFTIFHSNLPFLCSYRRGTWMWAIELGDLFPCKTPGRNPLAKYRPPEKKWGWGGVRK